MKKVKQSERPQILLVTRSIILNKQKILLIQRSSKDKYNPEKWEIPGGKFDKGDSVNRSVEREIIEEVDLYAEPLSSLAYYDSASSAGYKYEGIPYIRFAGLYKSDTQRVKLSEEHDTYKWVTFTEALEMDLTEFTRKSLLAWEKRIKDHFWNS